MSKPLDKPLPLPTALVVDDDPASRLLLRRWLERRGWEVHGCSTTEAGTAAYRHESLVLARPGMRGLDDDGLRRLVGRVREDFSDDDPSRDLPRGDPGENYLATGRPLLLAIRDGVRGDAAEANGAGSGWDEVLEGPIDESTLARCTESIDRWLASLPRLAAAVAGTPMASAASPFELEAGSAAIEEPSLEAARTLADKAHFGVVIFDAGEEIVYANARHYELLGIGVREAGGIAAWLRTGCPDRAYAEKAYDTWRRQIWRKQLTRTFTLKSRDEKLKDIEFRPRLLDDGGLLVMLSDVTELRRTRDTLAIVQSKFNAVFRHLPIGVAMVDRSGRLFDVNPALSQMLDCPRSDLLKRTLDECLAGGDVEKLRALEAAAESGERAAADGNQEPEAAASSGAEMLHLRRASGAEILVEATVTAPERAPAGGSLRTYFFRDVREEHGLRRRLEISREQNRALLNASADVVVLLNRHGRIEDLVLPSHGAFGGDARRWVNCDLSEMLPGFAGSDFLSVGEVIRSGEPRQFGFSQTNEAGTAECDSHFEVRVVPCGGDHAVAVVRDLTLAVEGEMALKREAVLGQHLQDAVIVCSPRGRIEDWNASAERTFGYRKHEILGCGLSKLYAPEDAAEFNRRLSQELNDHKRWAAETDFVRKSGEVGRCEVLFLPILRDEVPVSLIGIHRTLPAES